MEVTNTIGRRKTAVARVYMERGNGNVIINNRDLKNYFSTEVLQNKVLQAFATTDTLGQYDVTVNVSGGGMNGQAEAIRLGIARALVDNDEQLKAKLRAEGLMTRDPRMVERKKFGRRKARRRFQFSKR
ncbi:MAG: 30S ribosomal protein S9 [Bacteroidetes bacterium]|jgi:small subunit ribosomal protein S9|nr:30S ribosomal protein S9 [Bacteroidota bacterium]